MKAMLLSRLVTLSSRIGTLLPSTSDGTQPRPHAFSQSDHMTQPCPPLLPNQPGHMVSHPPGPSSQQDARVSILTLKKELEQLAWSKVQESSPGGGVARGRGSEGCVMEGVGSGGGVTVGRGPEGCAMEGVWSGEARWKAVEDVDVWARCSLGVCPGQTVGTGMFDFIPRCIDGEMHQVIQLDSKY